MRNILLVMMLSGGLAGIAGVSEVAGISHRPQLCVALVIQGAILLFALGGGILTEYPVRPVGVSIAYKEILHDDLQP